MSKDQHPFGHGIPGFGSDGNERLEEILRGQSAQAASETFRSRLKQGFVDGEAAAQAAVPESVSKRLVETLDSQPAPALQPEFRSKMRGLFLDQEAQIPAQEPIQEPVREMRAGESAAKKPGNTLSVWAPLAAVAALLVVFLGSKFWGAEAQEDAPSAQVWSLPGDVQDVEWTIDGEAVLASQSAQQVAARLETAQSVAAVDGGMLRLSYGRLFQVQLSAGSELDLSGFHELESGSEYHLGMLGESGGFCFQTGPDFEPTGCELTFQTPEAEICVVGTVFAVDRFPDGSAMAGTCICCAEGTVQVNATHQRRIATAAGKSCFVVPGDGELANAAVVHDHMTPMNDLREAETPDLWLD